MAEIKLDGMDTLQKVFRGKVKKLSKSALKTVVSQNASELMREAKRKAPVKTGFLQGSITMTFEDTTTAVIEPYMDYAPYVEYGTRFMKAQPYMKPALEAQRPVFIKDLMKLVKG